MRLSNSNTFTRQSQIDKALVEIDNQMQNAGPATTKLLAFLEEVSKSQGFDGEVTLVLVLVPALVFSARQVHLSTTCAGLISSTDYAQAVHLQPQRQSMGVQTADKLDGGEPAE